MINEDPMRTYDFNFQSLSVHPGFTGVELNEIELIPRFTDSLDVVVYGALDQASIRGLRWRSLVFGGSLILGSIEFKQPEFRIYRRVHSADESLDTAVSDSVGPAQQGGLQSLFADLLERGQLSAFIISAANAGYFLTDVDTVEFAQVFALNIRAEGIQTDELQWNNPVPFAMDRFQLGIASVHFAPNDDIAIKTGSIGYDSKDNKLSLRALKMNYTRDWVLLSREMGEQKDLYELEFDSLDLTGIRALNRIFDDLEIDAKKLQISGLQFNDYKNKNLPLKKTDYKPMFHGMVRRIPVPVQLDTLEIRNSRIEYREIAEHYDKPGVIVFDDFAADVYHLSNIRAYQQEYPELVANLRARFNGSGALKAQLEVPYRGEHFQLVTEMGAMPLSALNTTLEPLAGVRITKGTVHRLKLEMQVDSTMSTNRLWLDYEDIAFDILDREEDEWHPKDQALLGLLAGAFVNKTNLPGDKHYRTAEYTAPRTVYKSPFNFMWASVKEGCMYILPGGVARSFLKHQGSDLSKEPKKKKSWFRKKEKEPE
ncbi:hypothetical protein GC167_07845 [bacterium]|nr:hypothetical protein [bacterium]